MYPHPPLLFATLLRGKSPIASLLFLPFFLFFFISLFFLFFSFFFKFIFLVNNASITYQEYEPKHTALLKKADYPFRIYIEKSGF